MEEQSRAAGLDPEEAADFVARMLLSFTGSPGRWDLSDRAQVKDLVRTEVLAALHPLPTVGATVTDDTMRPP
jgi:hypothetical protein